jgi:hypothetical protein
MESYVEKSKPAGIDSTLKNEMPVGQVKILTNLLPPRSPNHRARAIRKRLLTKNLAVIGLVVIDASHHHLSRH